MSMFRTANWTLAAALGVAGPVVAQDTRVAARGAQVAGQSAPAGEQSAPSAEQGAPVAAQHTPAPLPVNRAQLRHQIYVMEGALAHAVQFGAQSLNREMRSVVPDVFMLAGDAQARGLYLDGYGIFFDVQVPIMRQSMMWSLRMMLDKDEAGWKAALDQLRQIAQKPALEPGDRAAAESSLKRLELQLNPMALANPGGSWGAGAPGRGPAVPAGSAIEGVAPPAGTPMAMGLPPQIEPPTVVPMDKLWMKDPNKAYTEAVQRAIIDTMIDYSAPMVIAVDEWLTVAARDNEPRDTLAPPNPLEETVTLLYQIKGSDLAAYRSQKIDRNEVIRRVVVREF